MPDDGVTFRTDPPDLFRRMSKYEAKVKEAIAKTMTAALLELWSNVPPYPPAPPGSRYKRTGQLGRSLGAGMGGGKSGQPDVMKVREFGSGKWEGRFGTNLKYAPRVIGEGSQESPWSEYWWTMLTIAQKSEPKIVKMFKIMAEKLAQFLEGRNTI